MAHTAFLPSKTKSAVAACLASEHTQAVLADPEFKHALVRVAREVSELAAVRREAQVIRSEIIHQTVSI